MLQKIEYNPSRKDEDFHRGSCKELTDWSWEEFLSLSGIYGYTNRDLIIKEFGEYPIIRIIILKRGCVTLVIKVDIQLKTIRNEFVEILDQTRSNGLHIFNSQVKAAGLAGFKYFTLEAARGTYEGNKKYIGYFVWAKFGYYMDDTSKEDFDNLMKRSSRFEKTLYELTYSEKKSTHDKIEYDGFSFWVEFGDTWEGIFDISDNSASINILKWYTDSKLKG